MGRARATAAVCVVGLGLLGASCTGDGGEQVLRTDGDTAPVAFEAAVRETFSGTGRYTFTMDDEDAADVTRTGEFSGDDIIGTETWEDEDPTTTLIADGVAYEKIGPATEEYWDVDASSLAGKSWIRMTPTPEGIAEMDLPDDVDPEVAAAMMTMDSMAGSDATAPQILSRLDRMLSRARDVRTDGSAKIGDRSFDRYRISLGGDQLFELYGVDPMTGMLSTMFMFGEGSLPEDVKSRVAELVDYLHDHTTLELTVLAAGDEVGRVEIRFTNTVDEAYEDCMFLDVESASTGTMTYEFTDLGAPISIVAPDPATVIAFGELEDDAMSYDEGFDVESDGEPTIGTSGGQWTRDDLEEWVIDDADRLGIDPVSVPALPQDQLVALYERSLALDGPMLETEWQGQMSRSSIVSSVIAGADRIDLDPAVVPSMSDADLVAAYDRIAELRYGNEDEGMVSDDLFEGCPG